MDYGYGSRSKVMERYFVMKKLFKTSLFVISIFCSNTSMQAHAEKSETYNQLNLFADVFERIRSQYVKEVEDEDDLPF